MPVHGVFRAALNGVHERGTGGFVYVRGDSCAYIFPHELTDQDDLRDTLIDAFAHESADRVFYVVEERDEKLHVLAYPREHVLTAVAEEEQGRIVEEAA